MCVSLICNFMYCTILDGIHSAYDLVEQLAYMVDLCPLMRSWSPVCRSCSTTDMTATVLSNAIGFSPMQVSYGMLLGKPYRHLNGGIATMDFHF